MQAIQFNNDITRRIIDVLFDGTFHQIYHPRLFICKSWQKYIYKHTTTYHLYNIKYITVCINMPKLTSIVIEDQSISGKYVNRLDVWLRRHPKFCSRVTCLDMIAIDIINNISSRFINLQRLILRHTELYQEQYQLFYGKKHHVPLLIVHAHQECTVCLDNITANTQIFIPASSHGLELRYTIFFDGSPIDNEETTNCLLADLLHDCIDYELKGCIISVINYTSQQDTIYLDTDSDLTKEERILMDSATKYGYTLELVRCGNSFKGSDRDIIRQYL